MQKSDLKGFYINLDRSVERRMSMEQGLARAGLDQSVERFSAREGDDRKKRISVSELGCLLSHQEIIQSITDDAPTLVLEDDLYFPPHFGRYLDIVLSKCLAFEWDILFLNKMISFAHLRSAYEMIKKKRDVGDIYADSFSEFSIEECKGLYISGSGAYLIRPGSAPKISEIIRESASLNYPKPVDIVYLDAIRSDRLKAKFVFPYILGTDWRHGITISSRAGGEDSPMFNDILNLFVAGGETE
ncbi:MAG: glycosyltransferase family 25 protein, partial [Rhizobiaceae bacterium]